MGRPATVASRLALEEELERVALEEELERVATAMSPVLGHVMVKAATSRCWTFPPRCCPNSVVAGHAPCKPSAAA